jgi:hypothetical protein
LEAVGPDVLVVILAVAFRVILAETVRKFMQEDEVHELVWGYGRNT